MQGQLGYPFAFLQDLRTNLPYYLLLFKNRAVFTNALVAVFCFAAATHASAKAAAHALLKAELAADRCCIARKQQADY